MSQLFASGSQSTGVSASTSVLPMNIRDWFPLGWTGWISLQSKGTVPCGLNGIVEGLVQSGDSTAFNGKTQSPGTPQGLGVFARWTSTFGGRDTENKSVPLSQSWPPGREDAGLVEGDAVGRWGSRSGSEAEPCRVGKQRVGMEPLGRAPPVLVTVGINASGSLSHHTVRGRLPWGRAARKGWFPWLGSWGDGGRADNWRATEGKAPSVGSSLSLSLSSSAPRPLSSPPREFSSSSV